MRNEARMGNAAVCDGVRLQFHGYEHDRFQQLYRRIWGIIQDATLLDDKELGRFIKPKVVRHDTSTKGSLRIIQLTGAAARYAHNLPWDLTKNLSQMHVKCYGVERFDGGHEAFVDAIYAGIGSSRSQLSFFAGVANPKQPKASGQKGTRIGSRKSDKQVVVYKRRGERPGIEARVQDKTLARCIKETEEYATSLDEMPDDRTMWVLLTAKVGRVGYLAALKTVREMGINIADFFEGVSPDPEPDSPRVTPFNYAEEDIRVNP